MPLAPHLLYAGTYKQFIGRKGGLRPGSTQLA